MAALTADEIARDLETAFVESDIHGVSCTCCAPAPTTEWTRLYAEAYFAVDRYRPGEVLTDETDESLDELIGRMVEASIVAVRETMIRMAAEALAGKVFPMPTERRL